MPELNSARPLLRNTGVNASVPGAQTPSKREGEARPHLLIVRFSSFGDIVQALSAPFAFHEHHAEAKVDWLVRKDFEGLLIGNSSLNEIFSFDRKQSIWPLLRLSWKLSETPYTHLYDAHSNLRSFFVRCVFQLRSWTQFNSFGKNRLKIVVRPKSRIRRFLYFKFGFKTLPEPFRGSASFLWPLAPWGIPDQIPAAPLFRTHVTLPREIREQIETLSHRNSVDLKSAADFDRAQLKTRPRIALIASAAWERKRWPVAHFNRLIELWPEADFVLLGGPEDTFLSEISNSHPEQTLNLAGKLSLAESSELLNQMDLVIANDTGLLHVADQLGRPTIALIGPSAFGYPSQKNSRVCEIKLNCKPCSKDGRDRCHNSLYKRCLVELAPETVLETAKQLLASSP